MLNGVSIMHTLITNCVFSRVPASGNLSVRNVLVILSNPVVLLTFLSFPLSRLLE